MTGTPCRDPRFRITRGQQLCSRCCITHEPHPLRARNTLPQHAALELHTAQAQRPSLVDRATSSLPRRLVHQLLGEIHQMVVRPLLSPHEFMVMIEWTGTRWALQCLAAAYVEQTTRRRHSAVAWGKTARRSCKFRHATTISPASPRTFHFGCTASRIERRDSCSCLPQSGWNWYNGKELTRARSGSAESRPGYNGDWTTSRPTVSSIGRWCIGGERVSSTGSLAVVCRHDILFRTGARPTIKFHQF